MTHLEHDENGRVVIVTERGTIFKKYQRKQVAEIAPWTPEYDMRWVSVSSVDIGAGSPKPGDMIARNPKNHDDQWLVAEQYFKDNFEEIE